jgi:hypothetical protein
MGRRCGACGRWFDEGAAFSTECKDCRGRTIIVAGGGGGVVVANRGGISVVSSAPVVKKVRHKAENCEFFELLFSQTLFLVFGHLLAKSHS